MPWVMLAMLAAEAVKHYAVDKPQEDAKQKLTADTQRLSPWTHMTPQQYDPTQRGDALSGLMQGGVTGLAMQQNMEKAAQQKKIQDAMLEKYKQKGGGADAMTASMGTGAGGVDPSNPWSLGVDTNMGAANGNAAMDPWGLGAGTGGAAAADPWGLGVDTSMTSAYGT